MKKMMFNDRYGLTDAVIEKRKTVTRRIITGKMSQCWLADCKNREFELIIENNNLNAYTSDKELYYSFGLPYKAGEIVAVAQSYNTIYAQAGVSNEHDGNHPGWTNKMFVCANLMPHQIRILDVRAERLQDITEEDCLREYPDCDIIRERHVNKAVSMGASVVDNWMSRRDVFAWLIDKISGKGTWNSNPFVWRIEFELIK